MEFNKKSITDIWKSLNICYLTTHSKYGSNFPIGKLEATLHDDTENAIHEYLWDAGEAVIREKFLVVKYLYYE